MALPRRRRSRASPLRGKYLVQDRIPNAGLALADGVLGLFRGWNRAGREVGRPRRILIAIGGHLGDAVIATSVLPVLRAAFPEAEIGVLVGSWARPVLEGHPLIRWFHVVDHWKLNRSGDSLAGRLRRYWRTRERALWELREVGYDAAVDLYAFFPNAAPLLWRAGIPVRVGYVSGGFGPLLTHALEWSEAKAHVTDHHMELLRVLGAAVPDQVRYALPPVPAAAIDEAATFSRAHGLESGAYLVLHLGAGNRRKEWPRERWRALAERLAREGRRLVFTGAGREQAAEVAAVTSGLTGCVDACDRLSWPAFVHVIQEAGLVVCVDTVAGHVASGVGTPCVWIAAGMSDPYYWRPVGGRTIVVTNPVPCSPCFRSEGCGAMACVRGVEVDAVYEAVKALLERGETDGAPGQLQRPAVGVGKPGG
jgi:ADP-heptose:LPS heptosyltransferase